MKECPACSRCFPDHVNHCPGDGGPLRYTIAGDTMLDGRYQLERRLGQGGMGMVFKARHIFLKTQHAVKVILPDLVGNDPSLITRFRQEAMAAAAIHHPNTIGVTDFGVINGTTPFLVMEFVEGRSLHDILQQEGRLAPGRALEIMLAVCAGVAAAHRQGIVHRDLKPLNILLKNEHTASEGVKVLDFGLAKIKSGELLGSFVAAQTQGMMGSPFYMAPEQWSDEEVDVRADIYSLGVILYQMLSGDVPFKGNSIPAIMKRHLTEPPPALSTRGVNVPGPLEAAVRHTLEKEADARPASVEEFMVELRGVLSGILAAGADGLGAQTIQIAQGDTLELPANRHGIERGGTAGTGAVADSPTNNRVASPAAQPPREAVSQVTVVAQPADGDAARQTGVEAAHSSETAQIDESEAVATRRLVEEERLRAEAEESERVEQEQRSRQASDELQRRREDEEEAQRRREAEEAERRRVEEEEERRRVELEARRRADVETRQRAEEQQRLEAEARERAEAEERRRAETEEQQRLEAQERERREAETREHKKSEERRRLEAEERERLQATEERQSEDRSRQAAGEASERSQERAEKKRDEENDRTVVAAARRPSPEVPASPSREVVASPSSEVPASPSREVVASTVLASAPASNVSVSASQPKSRTPLMVAGALVVLALLGGIAALAFYLRDGATGTTNTSQGAGGANTAANADTNQPSTPPARPDMVSLTGGDFRMGRDDVPPISDRQSATYLLWIYSQWPAHAVNVKPFAVDRTEVTSAEYAEFVKATGHAPPPDVWAGNNPKPGEEKWPVRNVSLDDALAFAAWRSQRDGVAYRLPTEEEWEFAARGGDASRLYPWGAEWVAGRAHFDGDAPRPVGSFPEGRTAQGVEDMVGNVWEWTSSTAAMYKGNNRTALRAEDRDKFVTRGGSYKSRATGDEPVTATSRKWTARDNRDPVLGFRLVRAAGQ